MTDTPTLKRRWRLPAALLLGGALVLAACGSSADEGATDSPTTTAQAGGSTSTSAFPVELKHAFGTTTIKAEPKRIVAIGFGSADAAIALGTTPVAIPFQAYGGDAEGVLPWIRKAVVDKGQAIPTVLPNSSDLPFDAIKKADPDLILAVYSGVTDTDYATLTAIAPTVAYPDKAYTTPWKDVVSIVGKALGKPTEAAKLVADVDAKVAAAAAKHPELKGKSVALVFNTADTFYVYKKDDARAAFTYDLGLTNAASVDKLSNGDSTFFYTLSREKLPELTSDILVSYADTQEASDAFLSSATAKLMPQVKSGAVAAVVGKEKIAAVSPPTALSLTYGLDEYVGLLATAAKAGK